MTPGWIIVSPAAGILGAAAVVGIVRWRVKPVTWASPVDGGAAWSPYDSWLTNISALSGFGGMLWAVFGSLGSVLTASLSLSVTIMFVVGAGSAGLAPLVYAALASKQATNTGEAVGTVAGLLLAAAATLFASFAELAAISLVVWATSAGAAARVFESLLQVLILAVVACISAYSGRTLYSVIVQSTVAPAGAGRPMSYLLTARAGARWSATL